MSLSNFCQRRKLLMYQEHVLFSFGEIITNTVRQNWDIGFLSRPLTDRFLRTLQPRSFSLPQPVRPKRRDHFVALS